MEHRNYALLVEENSHYPVSYTIKQDGTKVIEDTMLKGGDMTENQIKEHGLCVKCLIEHEIENDDEPFTGHGHGNLYG